MILYGFLMCIVLSSFVALSNWRRGFYLFILIALLQDPVRKVVPGAPGYLAMSTVPVFIAMMFRSFSNREEGWFALRRGFPQLARAMSLFVLAMLPAAVISGTYGEGSWQVTLMGAFSYGSLLTSMVLGYAFHRRGEDLPRLLGFYTICASALLIGTPLEYFHVFPDWAALGTKSMGFEWLRYIPGMTLKMVAGFFRSPDIMGWHAATVTMFSLCLAVRSRGKSRYLWIALAAWGVSGAIFCGRRKMILLLPLFISALTWVYWRRYGMGHRMRLGTIAAVLVLSVGGTVAIYRYFSPDEAFMRYYTYDPGDIVDRFEAHGIDSVKWTFRQAGLMGAGLGTATQGVHHLRVQRPRTWQEGGISRIAVELGLPGLILFFYLVYCLARALLAVLFRKLDSNSPNFTIYAGLFGILLANAAAFVVSGQIFGDPFIFCLFSFLIGLALGGARTRVNGNDAEWRSSRTTRFGKPPFAGYFAGRTDGPASTSVAGTSPMVASVTKDVGS